MMTDVNNLSTVRWVFPDGGAPVHAKMLSPKLRTTVGYFSTLERPTVALLRSRKVGVATPFRCHRHRAHRRGILVEISAAAASMGNKIRCVRAKKDCNESFGSCRIRVCRAEAERQNSKVLCGLCHLAKRRGTSFGGIIYYLVMEPSVAF